MKPARVAMLSFLGLSSFFAGCVGIENDRVATYQKIDERYLIEVSGTRTAMAHDPSALLRHKTYQKLWQFDVPRVEGKIDGSEIRQKPGFLPYVGSITIHAKKMVVSLAADNYSYHELETVEWNGSYTLIEKK
jgi:hypothetical protein